MSFRGGDSLLEASVVPGSNGDADLDAADSAAEDNGQKLSPSDTYVFVVTEGGYAKRTRIEDYRKQQRGGLGIKVAKLSEDRGDLAGALIASGGDEVLVVLASGKVVRSDVAEVPAKGRDTMGVVFAKFADDDRIIAIARNSERNLVEEAAESDAAEPAREE
jgi:DNA gyrase subunit A